MQQGIIKRSISPAGPGPLSVQTPIGARPVAVILDGHNVPAVLFEGDPLQEGLQTVELYVTTGDAVTVDPEGQQWAYLGSVPALGSPQVLTVWRMVDAEI